MPQESKFRLLDTDPNITEDSAFGTTWRDTWKFQCPSHMRLILKKGDYFSLHAEDSADAEYAAPDSLVQIEVRDPSEQKKINVYGPANYNSSKEFQDFNSMAQLDLDVPIIIKPRDFIVFMTKDSVGMDAASVANSYCRLITTKIVEVEGGKL